MKAVSSTDIIQSLIKKVRQYNKGYVTNFFPDIPKIELWIRLNLLVYVELEETLFLVRKNQGFNNLFFISTGIASLTKNVDIVRNKFKDEIFVIDLVGDINYVSELRNKLEGKEYYCYTSLVRMNKIGDVQDADTYTSGYLSYADLQKGKIVFDLLQEYFDPFAEQLPLLDEIHNWVKANKIIIYSMDYHTVQGFLIFELAGQTSYLRYWFVHPDYRDMKIGSTLLRKFFEESRKTKRQLFWVIESNQNAIIRYEHYGFKREDLFDYVMINRNLNYEG